MKKKKNSVIAPFSRKMFGAPAVAKNASGLPDKDQVQVNQQDWPESYEDSMVEGEDAAAARGIITQAGVLGAGLKLTQRCTLDYISQNRRMSPRMLELAVHPPARNM